MARTSKLPQHLIQSILVPKSHRDVKGKGLGAARKVARKYGDLGGTVVETKNFYDFRQFDPSLASKNFVSYKTPSGVVIRSAKPRADVLRQGLTLHGEVLCEEGDTGRRKVLCRARYVDGKGVVIEARMTRAEAAKAPKKATLGALVGKLGKSRARLVTRKAAEGRKSGGGKPVSIERARKPAKAATTRAASRGGSILSTIRRLLSA